MKRYCPNCRTSHPWGDGCPNRKRNRPNGNWEGATRRHLTAKQKNAVKARAGYRCENCGTHDDGRKKFQIDHITPVAMEGSDDFSNLQLLCVHCHKMKLPQDRRRINRFKKGHDR